MTTEAIAKLPAVVESLSGMKMTDLLSTVAEAAKGERKELPPATHETKK